LCYCAGGDLCTAIAADDFGELQWYNRGHQIALDIARGLYFLHSHDVSTPRTPHYCLPNQPSVDLEMQLAGWCGYLMWLEAFPTCAEPLSWSRLQVMHLDLKTKNVLLTADMVGKVHMPPPAASAVALGAPGISYAQHNCSPCCCVP
jgi:serine/threonine protein kinase